MLSGKKNKWKIMKKSGSKRMISSLIEGKMYDVIYDLMIIKGIKIRYLSFLQISLALEIFAY